MFVVIIRVDVPYVRSFSAIKKTKQNKTKRVKLVAVSETKKSFSKVVNRNDVSNLDKDAQALCFFSLLPDSCLPMSLKSWMEKGS